MRNPPRVRCAIAVALALLSSSAYAQDAPQPTPGFTDSVALIGLDFPTAVAFSPDGRIFVAEKAGMIKVFDNLQDTTPTVVADLRTQVHNYWDRGLLGLALHPSFPAVPQIFVLYAHDAPIGGTAPTYGGINASGDDDCPPNAATDGCIIGGRLSRLDLAPDGTWTEHVLIEDWFQQFGSHSIGSLVFGSDGALYASGGDGASWDYVDYGQTGNPTNAAGDPPVPIGGTQTPPTAEGGALRAQDLRTSGDPVGLNGSIVRIDPETGEGLPDNPLASNADANARRIVAYGMRNPFRFTLRPGTRELWLGDVGWRRWEEINVVPDPTAAGGPLNFGWPCYEGNERQQGYEAAGLDICRGLYADPAAVTMPRFQYRQGFPVSADDHCAVANGSLSGMAFNDGDAFPAPYRGALFFADYSRSCIWVMPPGADGTPSPALVRTFIAQAAAPVDLKMGPGGDLFYVDIAGGTVHRVHYDGGSAPQARLTATPASGPLPLNTVLDASASSDPEGEALSYAWDLNADGVYDDATGPTLTQSFGTEGTFVVGLQVSDPAGHTSTASASIVAGDTAPTPVIDTPAADVRWRVGQAIAFSGHAADVEDGALPDSALTWTLILNHCSSATSCHQHFLRELHGAASDVLVAPDHPYPSYLTLRLSATDSRGVTGTVERRLDPQTIDVTFDSAPHGLQIAVGDEVLTTPATRTVILGSTVSLSAPSPAWLGGAPFGFGSWSDGGAAAHNITADGAVTTYTATFIDPATTIPSPWSSPDIGEVGVAGSAWFADGTFTVRGGGADVWGTADALHLLAQPFTGDGSITARVVTNDGTEDWTKIGVMIRGGLEPGAAQGFMLVSTAKGLAFQRRPSSGALSVSTAGPPATAPRWLRLTRTGSRVTASTSADGTTWTVVGSATIELPPTALFGLAVSSHNRQRLATATFDHVTLEPASPAPVTLPDGWRSTDIGAVGISGSSSGNAGTFTVSGGGADIWGTADAFQFAYTTLTGDGSIIARVTSVEPLAAWTKAGVMMRAALTAGSQHGVMLVSPAKGTAYQRRPAADGLSVNTAGPMSAAPYWVKLTRTGSTITALSSPDGTSWSTVAADTITMPPTIYVGVVVGSHIKGTLATAVFDDVTVTGSTTPAPPSNSTLVLLRDGGQPSGGYGQISCQGLQRALALPPVLVGRYGAPQYLFAPNPAAQIADGAGTFDYVRALAMIEPTAARFGMPVSTRYGVADIGPLQTTLMNLATSASTTVFVSWEAGKLQELVQAIVNTYGDGATVPSWPATDYDRLYVLHVTTSGGTTSVTFDVDTQGLNGVASTCP